MEKTTVTAIIIVGLVVASTFSLIDDAFKKMLNPFFRLFELQSLSAPIDITVKQKSKSIEFSIADNGKGKAIMVAIQVIDGDAKSLFPTHLISEDDVGEGTSEKA